MSGDSVLAFFQAIRAPHRFLLAGNQPFGHPLFSTSFDACSTLDSFMNPSLTEPLLSIFANRELCELAIRHSPHLQTRLNEHAAEVHKSQLESPLQFDPRRVEVRVNSETLNQLFDVVARQWTVCGEKRPHHSVLSSDEYLPQNLTSETLQRLYQSGVQELQLLVDLCAKNEISLTSDAHCLELGCGVGRVTIHLARAFRTVTGIDISPGNLHQCQSVLNHLGIQNATLQQLCAFGELETVPNFDVFFSRIVFQHNPPPVQKYLLDTVLRKLNPGGVALFQMVTGGPGYAYSAASHLSHHKVDDYEMHALPMRYIFESFHENHCRPIEVLREMAGGFNVASHTFLAQKTR
jgi:2-polyprenyl-3-methyl-5-hydroxy-6-metoxy-1,4-benzoquinol methylase